MRDGMTSFREKVAGKAQMYLDGLAQESRGDKSLQLDLVAGYLKVADIQGNRFVADLVQTSAARNTAAKALAKMSGIGLKPALRSQKESGFQKRGRPVCRVLDLVAPLPSM